MGEVWLAEDATLKPKVALKVLLAAMAMDSDRPLPAPGRSRCALLSDIVDVHSILHVFFRRLAPGREAQVQSTQPSPSLAPALN